MSRNTLVTIVCLVVVAGGLGIYFFFFNSNTDAALSVSSQSASQSELTFIALVAKLDAITYDTSILSDPRFVSRQNIKTAIVPEAAGRKDPFAPIGR